MLLTFGACASGSEISTLLYGSIEFGMVEENPNNNRLVMRTILQNSTIHVPQGVLHFSHNPNCEPAAFLANFAHSDPGTQSTWNSLMRIPTRILHSATGIDEAIINRLKQYPLVTAPGTGMPFQLLAVACICTAVWSSPSPYFAYLIATPDAIQANH